MLYIIPIEILLSKVTELSFIQGNSFLPFNQAVEMSKEGSSEIREFFLIATNLMVAFSKYFLYVSKQRIIKINILHLQYILDLLL